MEFGKEKSTILIRNRKRQLTEGTVLPNQEKTRTLIKKETYKYFGILEAENIKQVEMKEKI